MSKNLYRTIGMLLLEFFKSYNCTLQEIQYDQQFILVTIRPLLLLLQWITNSDYDFF